MMAIPAARAHNTQVVLYTKLLGIRCSSMCQLPVHVCVSCGHYGTLATWLKTQFASTKFYDLYVKMVQGHGIP